MRKNLMTVLSVLVCVAMLLTLLPLLSSGAELNEVYFNNFLDAKSIEGYSFPTVPANGEAGVADGTLKLIDNKPTGYDGVDVGIKTPAATGNKIVFSTKVKTAQAVNFFIRQGSDSLVYMAVLPDSFLVNYDGKNDTILTENGFANGKEWIDIRVEINMASATYSIEIKSPSLKSKMENTVYKEGIKFNTTKSVSRVDSIRIKTAAGGGDTYIDYLKLESDGAAVTAPATTSTPGASAAPATPTPVPENAVDVTDKVTKAISLKTREGLKDSIVLYLGSPTAYINTIVENKKTPIDSNNSTVVPVVVADRTLVPLRFVGESFGAGVKWIEETQEIQLSKRTTQIMMKIDSTDYTVNGESKTMDVVPQLIGDRTFVPLRAAAEAFGQQVFWDDRGLIIIGPKASDFNNADLKSGVEEVVGLYTGANTISFYSKSKPQNLLFNSGFDGTTAFAPDDLTTVKGVDASFTTLNDWGKDVGGDFVIQYEGGTPEQRHAKIIDDPTKAGNKVLEFSLSDANVRNKEKGRVQSCLYYRKDLQEFYYTYRWYIHPDVEKLTLFPGQYSWLTVQEYWNDGGWVKSLDYYYRFSLSLRKGMAVGAPLYFGINGEIQEKDSGRYDRRWSVANEDVHLPFGQWVTAEVYVKEGDGADGRFYFAITPDDGEKQVVFALATETKNPNEPVGNGIWGLNPMKVYCGPDVTNFMQSHGVPIHWYYDDFKLGTGRPDFVGSNITWTEPIVESEKPAPIEQVNMFEAEDIFKNVSAGCKYEIVEDPSLSGGKGVLFFPGKDDDFMDVQPRFSEGGHTFKVSVGFKAGPENGKFQYFTTDAKGEHYCEIIDTYAAAAENRELPISDLLTYKSAGAKATKIISKGKNDASSGNAILVDYFKYEIVKAP